MSTQILMPALSPTMTEGNLAKWVKKEDTSSPAMSLLRSKPKATMEVEAVDEGVIGKILVAEGAQGVAVNTAIAVLLAEGESPADIGKAAMPQKAQNSAGATSPVAPPPAEEKKSIASTRDDKGGARRPAAGQTNRKGSGGEPIWPRSRGPVRMAGSCAPMLKMQRPLYPAARKVAPVASDARQLADLLGMTYTALPNSGVRKVIAARLSESKQTIPHFYLTVECRIDRPAGRAQGAQRTGRGGL